VPASRGATAPPSGGSRFAPSATSQGEEGRMLKNATYNLIETASVISKGLHRYDTFQKDAMGCQQCQQLWNHMKQADEEELARIVGHMKQHLEAEEDLKRAAA
jgi:hypothetical protein